MKCLTLLRFIGLCVVVSIFSSHPVIAQWSQDPAVATPVSARSGIQNNPQMVSDGAGGAIIAWTDMSNPDAIRIQAQRLSSAGVRLWFNGEDPNGITVSESGVPLVPPAIAPDGAGGAIIAWQTGDNDIHAQRLDANGHILWGDGGAVVTSADGQQVQPVIAPSSAGSAIIAWNDGASDTVFARAQRLNSAGKRMWIVHGDSNGVLLSHKPVSSDHCSIVSDDSLGAIVAWSWNTDIVNGVTEWDLEAQRIVPSGELAWGVNGIVACNNGGTNVNPVLAPDGAHGAFVAFGSLTKPNLIEVPSRLVQRIRSNGSIWASPVTLSQFSDYASPGAICPDGSGGCVTTWTEISTFEPHLQAQRIDANGTALWAAASTVTTAPAITPAITHVGAGKTVVAWLDFRMDVDIYAQELTANGTKIWVAANDSDGVPVCTATGEQIYPVLCPGTKGTAIVTWTDWRGGAYEADIYASQFGNISSADSLAPADFQASGFSPTVVRLTWTDQTGNETGFTVTRRTAGSNFGAVIANLPPDSHEYWDSTAQEVTKYYYQVKVTIPGGASYQSDVDSVTTMIVPPGGLSALPSGNGFLISWQDRSAKETGFRLLRSVPPSNVWVDIANLPPNTTEAYDYDLTDGVTYMYMISDTNAMVKPGHSNLLTATYHAPASYTPKQWSDNPAANLAIHPGNPLNVRYASPCIESDGNGGAYVALLENAVDNSTTYRILAQHFRKDGVQDWGSVGVPVSQPVGPTSWLTTKRLSNGDIAVAWVAAINDNSRAVFIQKFDQGGNRSWIGPDGNPNGIRVSNDDWGLRPTLTEDNYGGVIVVWEHPLSTASEILASWYNSNGVRTWGGAHGLLLGNSYASYFSNPILPIACCADGNGGVYAAYNSWEHFGTCEIQHATGKGQTTLGTGLVLSEEGAAFSEVHLAPDGTGGAYVAWSESFTSGFDWRGRFQHITRDGYAWGIPDPNSVSTVNADQYHSTVAEDGFGNAIVAWADVRNGNADIYVQKFNPEGIRMWDPAGVLAATAHVHGTEADLYRSLSLVPDGDHGAIICWKNADISNRYQTIVAQRVDGEGTPLWGENGAAVSTQGGQKAYPMIAPQGTGGGIVVWMQPTDDPPTAYIQNIDPFGYCGVGEPKLVSVRDVPGDQGGYVSARWNASVQDKARNGAIDQYEIYRGVSPSAASRIPAAALLTKTGPGINGKTELTYWEKVGAVASAHLTGYSFAVRTPADSGAPGVERCRVMVRARGAKAWYDSDPDSAYSVDNLAPMPPSNFNGSVAGTDIRLHWRANKESDLAGYALYRESSLEAFSDTSNPVAFVNDTTSVDPNPAAVPTRYYAVRAIDIHGNKSAFSAIVPIIVAGASDGSDLPKEYSMGQNYPNPFNPTTAITYQLPVESRVTLTVSNTLGQMVRTLVSEIQQPGERAVTLDATALASGLYFYRLEASSTADPGHRYIAVRKMLLVK